MLWSSLKLLWPFISNLYATSVFAPLKDAWCWYNRQCYRWRLCDKGKIAGKCDASDILHQFELWNKLCVLYLAVFCDDISYVEYSVQNCKIHHSVIGLRSCISEGAIIEDTLLMGADYYEVGAITKN